MTQLYLQRVEISNSRAYGDNFVLSLPGPGVTIVVGPEGLGKSTFFEAIEWALGREEDVPVAQYGVSLEFVNSEGESTRIERRAVREQEKGERFVGVSSPSQQQLMELLREETLNAWQQLEPTDTEARARHAAAQATLVGLQNRLQAVLEVDERRRAAEFKRDTLLQLSAARTKTAQGLKQKASVTARIDRHTHEMWMMQSYLRDTTKTLQRIKDLDSRIGSLLVAKQELESRQQAHDTSESHHPTQLELEAAQAARAELPDLESLTDQQASTKERIGQLASTIKEEHEAVARIEEELLAAQALQQQYPELLSALGKLPSDEAHAIDEAVRAVEHLVHHERQLVQSEEPFSSVVSRLNEAIAQARQAEQESELQRLRERQKRLTDALLARQNEEELRQTPGVGDGAASRWPALLLDEPLQHQDLIHAEAFIEILRNLVRDRKYQVILSVQNEELADSLHRKLEAIGIECVTCR